MSTLKKVLIMMVEIIDESQMSDDLKQKLQELTTADMSNTGFSSMELQAIVGKISKEFGVELKIADLEQIKTIQDLVDYIDR